MCGRYASSRKPEDLIDEFDISDTSYLEPLPADYNVAPSVQVYAVLERAREDGIHRQLRSLRWGLVPSWAKEASIGNRLINARIETVAEKPSFRRAFASRRCLLPADGYYEWYTLDDVETARGKPVKQPFFIRPKDGSVLAMAGLYEIWRDPSKSEDDDDRFLWSMVVLTTRAEDDLGRIHDRMPLLVTPERRGQWLDPENGSSDVLQLLTPAAPGLLEAYPVSKAVNSVKNNGPDLVRPLEAE